LIQEKQHYNQLRKNYLKSRGTPIAVPPLLLKHGSSRGEIAPTLIFYFFCFKAKEQKEHYGRERKEKSLSE
jgi:hypothetical protein